MKTTYERILNLCEQKNISIASLEKLLGLSSNCIRKWKTATPTSDKLLKVAKYFNVSTDYLMCRTDSPDTVDSLLDDDILIIQRAKRNMSDKDKEKMKQILKVTFAEAFGDDS